MDIVKFAKENYGDFVKRANPAMNKMTALQTLLSGKDLSKEEVPLIKEFKSVQEFLDLPRIVFHQMLFDELCRAGSDVRLFQVGIVFAQRHLILAGLVQMFLVFCAEVKFKIFLVVHISRVL